MGAVGVLLPAVRTMRGGVLMRERGDEPVSDVQRIGPKLATSPEHANRVDTIRDELAQTLFRSNVSFTSASLILRMTDQVLASPAIRRLRAETWDEGARAVTIQRDGHGGIIPAPSTPNPYRPEETTR